MKRLLIIISILFLSGNMKAQNWRKSSFDLSFSYIGLNPKIHEQLKNEFISNSYFNNKFNYQEAKKAKIDTPNYNYPSTVFVNFNYVMKRYTDFLIFRHLLFTSGINLNFSDRGNYEFSVRDSSANYYNEVFGNFVERKNGFGINLGIGLLSKPFLKVVKFQAQIFNCISPFSSINYSSSSIIVNQNIEGNYYNHRGGLPEFTNSPGKLMNNTQLKLGFRFNVDCTGNVFVNYITNYTIYKGKPDIKYTGLFHGIEFGINYLLDNEAKAIENPNSFW